MIRRGTLVVLGIFVLLIGVTWYLEWSPAGKARARGTPTATGYPSILSVSTAQMIKIELKDSNGTFGIQRNLNDTWSFMDDQSTPADQGKIQELLASLAGLQSIATLDAKSLSAFGLVTTNRILTIQTTNGSTVLKVGNVTATGSGYYVQVDNHAPVVIDKTSLDQVLNTLNRQTLSPATATPLPGQLTPAAGTPSPLSTATP